MKLSQKISTLLLGVVLASCTNSEHDLPTAVIPLGESEKLLLALGNAVEYCRYSGGRLPTPDQWIIAHEQRLIDEGNPDPIGEFVTWVDEGGQQKYGLIRAIVGSEGEIEYQIIEIFAESELLGEARCVRGPSPEA